MLDPVSTTLPSRSKSGSHISKPYSGSDDVRRTSATPRVMQTQPSATNSIQDDFKIRLESLRDVKSSISVFQRDEVNKSYLAPPGNMSHPDISLKGKQSKAVSKTTVMMTMKQLLQPAENEFTLKLLGYEHGLEKEIDRMNNQQHNFIIHPCSKFRSAWDTLVLVLCCVNIVVLPLFICLFEDYRETWWITYNTVCDSIFLLDIVINFRTGYISHNDVILDPKLMARQYIRTWFIPDLLSSIPFDMLLEPMQPLSEAGKALKMLRILKLISLIRLLRLSRLWRYVLRLETVLGFTGWAIPLINVLCLIFTVLHWLACLHFLVARLEDFPSNSWVKLNSLQDSSKAEIYEYSFFRTMSHMMCIGYGRYSPQGRTDICMVTISTMIGGLCYTIIIARLVTTYQHFTDSGKTRYREQLNEVEDFMNAKHLPKDLRKKIIDYFDHRYQGSIFREDVIFKQMNPYLQTEIYNFTCRSMVERFPLLSKLEGPSMYEVVSKLKREVYQPGDIIFYAGEEGDKMFFVEGGTVQVDSTSMPQPVFFSTGSYFGEVSLMISSGRRRLATATSLGYTFLYTLDIDEFEKMVNLYPKIKYAMEVIAAKRTKDMGGDPNLITSREELDEELRTIEEAIKNSTSQVSVIPATNEGRRSSAFLQNIGHFFTGDDSIRRIVNANQQVLRRFTETSTDSAPRIGDPQCRRGSIRREIVTPQTSQDFPDKRDHESQRNNNSIKDTDHRELEDKLQDLANRLFSLEFVTKQILDKCLISTNTDRLADQDGLILDRRLATFSLDEEPQRHRPSANSGVVTPNLNGATPFKDTIQDEGLVIPSADGGQEQRKDNCSRELNATTDTEWFKANSGTRALNVNKVHPLQKGRSPPKVIEPSCGKYIHQDDIEERLNKLTTGQESLCEGLNKLTSSVDKLSQLLSKK